jgi:hypothetical protein
MNCPPTFVTLKLVVKYWKSCTLTVEVWPLKRVIFGACITLIRRLTPTETRFLAEALEITDLGGMGGDVDTESSSIHY